MTTGARLAGCGLTRRYPQGQRYVEALSGVDLEVWAGEFVAITGPSGSGKSTLLHLLSGLDRPDGGQVMLDGMRLTDLDDLEMALVRRRRFGYVLQFFNLLPSLNLLENVAFPLSLDGVAGAKARAMAELGRVGLAGRAQHRPSQLSGGEQQRAAVARALVTNPAVVFADEPTGNLDQTAGGEILTLLRSVADMGHTVVMVTHDPRSADFASRSVALVDGIAATDDGSCA